MNKLKKLKSFIFTSATILFIIHLFNKLVFFIAGAKELLYSRHSNFYQWRFGKVFYTKQGKGSPLLLIHDLSHVSSEIEWKLLVDDLSKKHTVYTIDLIGCGRSEKPEMTYTSFLYVQLLNDFIKNVIKSKTNVVASGFSSSIVIMACNMDSSLYQKIFLINPTDMNQLKKCPHTRDKLMKYVIHTPIIGTLIYNIFSRKTMIRKAFENEYFYNEHKIRDRFIDCYYEAAHLNGSSSKYLFASNFSNYTNCNITHALKSINNSIFIAIGDQVDNYNNIIDEYVEINPSIETNVINNTKGLPHLEKPKSILSLFDMFF